LLASNSSSRRSTAPPHRQGTEGLRWWLALRNVVGELVTVAASYLAAGGRKTPDGSADGQSGNRAVVYEPIRPPRDDCARYRKTTKNVSLRDRRGARPSGKWASDARFPRTARGETGRWSTHDQRGACRTRRHVWSPKLQGRWESLAGKINRSAEKNSNDRRRRRVE